MAGGKKCSSNAAAELAVNGYFSGLNLSHFSEGMKGLEKRQTKYIELQGDYVEKSNGFCPNKSVFLGQAGNFSRMTLVYSHFNTFSRCTTKVEATSVNQESLKNSKNKKKKEIPVDMVMILYIPKTIITQEMKRSTVSTGRINHYDVSGYDAAGDEKY